MLDQLSLRCTHRVLSGFNSHPRNFSSAPLTPKIYSISRLHLKFSLSVDTSTKLIKQNRVTNISNKIKNSGQHFFEFFHPAKCIRTFVFYHVGAGLKFSRVEVIVITSNTSQRGESGWCMEICAASRIELESHRVMEA